VAGASNFRFHRGEIVNVPPPVPAKGREPFSIEQMFCNSWARVQPRARGANFTSPAWKGVEWSPLFQEEDGPVVLWGTL